MAVLPSGKSDPRVMSAFGAGRRFERDDLSSNRHPALVYYLSMISAQTLRACREGKSVPTFPDHALGDVKPILLQRITKTSLPRKWRGSLNGGGTPAFSTWLEGY